MNSIAMFCCTLPITSDSPLCAASHVPVPGDTLVLSRLDYRNAVLVGLPAYLVRHLQSVLNVAARLIYRMRSADHISDALACLHWLRIQKRIDYKVAVLTYKVLHESVPQYLGSGTTRSCCRSARMTDITLWWHQSFDGAIYQTFNSW